MTLKELITKIVSALKENTTARQETQIASERKENVKERTRRKKNKEQPTNFPRAANASLTHRGHTNLKVTNCGWF